MRIWKKGMMVIALLIGFNLTIIPAMIPRQIINMESIKINSEASSIGTAIDVSVPSIGADDVWLNMKDPDENLLTGNDTIVGIVDTGIDYRHPDFFFPNWSTQCSIISGTNSTIAADLNNNSAGDLGEDLYQINSVDGGGAWDAEYDWLILDKNSDTQYDYGTDCYALTLDEDGQGDLDIGETVVLLTESKILEIIDMTSGKNWTQAEIENGTAATYDFDGHGTNVVGIAIGGQLKQDGSRFHKFAGAAPNANLIFIKIGNQSKNLYTDPLLYQALLMLSQKGVDVISLSLGAYMWRHLDGTSTLEQLIDSLDCKVVVAAGNLQNKFVHQEQIVAAGMMSCVPFVVSQYSSEPEIIRISVIWDQTGVPLDFNLTYYGPVGGWVPWPSPGPHPAGGFPCIDRVSLLNPNPTMQTINFPIIGIRVDYWLDTSSRTRLLCINMTTGIVAGTYTIDIFNSPVDLFTQCYIWDNKNQFINVSYPIPPPPTMPGWVFFGFEMNPPPGPITMVITATPEYTVTHPATATNAIAVGAYNLADGTLSKFSSIGSTDYSSLMDGYEKPDLCAPGEDTNTKNINSTVSRNVIGSDLSIWTSHVNTYRGTSQAAPHVAGAIALMLQKNNSLTISQIKSNLRSSAVNDSAVGIVPNYRWGFGKLNITAAVLLVQLPYMPGGPGIPWWLWMIIIGVILMVVVIMILRKKKKRDSA